MSAQSLVYDPVVRQARYVFLRPGENNGQELLTTGEKQVERVATVHLVSLGLQHGRHCGDRLERQTLNIALQTLEVERRVVPEPFFRFPLEPGAPFAGFDYRKDSLAMHERLPRSYRTAAGLLRNSPLAQRLRDCLRQQLFDHLLAYHVAINPRHGDFKCLVACRSPLVGLLGDDVNRAVALGWGDIVIVNLALHRSQAMRASSEYLPCPTP